MAFSLANVKSITIPEGSVRRIFHGDQTIWSKIKTTTYTFSVKAENAEGYDIKEFSVKVDELS